MDTSRYWCACVLGGKLDLVGAQENEMGRISTKENKTRYQEAREKLGYSREKVAEITEIEPFRIERIENEKISPDPWDICAMAKAYKDPSLCNHYCANECPIGMKYVPEVSMKDLSQVVLEMLASLNSMSKSRERLIEITADGVIGSEELADFVKIQKELERISVTVETLQLWTEKMIADGKIDMAKYQELTGKKLQYPKQNAHLKIKFLGREFENAVESE